MLQSLMWFISIHLVQMCLCPTFGECRLHTKILFSMILYRRMSMNKSSKHAAGPSMASAFRVCQFVRENSLLNRPYMSLWLGKMYVLSAGVYASQVWSTEFIKEDEVFTSDLQGQHISVSKGTLGVKRTTTSWAVLRGCGHELLQFYWFRSAVKLYNSMLKSNSETLSRMLKADLSFHSREPSCWTLFFPGLRCFLRVMAL